MTETKRAHPEAATPERAERGNVGHGFSRSHDSTPEVRAQGGLVTAYLRPGKENAMSGAKLVEVMKLKDLRSLTQLIERERQAGAPICASVSGPPRGYYLATDPDALAGYLRSFDRRLKAINCTRRQLNDTLDRLTGQQRLEE